MSMLTLSMVLILLGACATNIGSFFLTPFAVWMPIVLTATMAVIVVAAFIYMLSPLAGRSDIRVWAKVKIYDGLLNIIFVLIFMSFATLLCTVTPSPLLSSVGLLPQVCTPGGSGSLLTGTQDNLFGLADCDIYTFNQDVISFSNNVYWTSIVLSASPAVTFFPAVHVASGATGDVSVMGTGISFSISLLPIQLIHHYIVPLMQGFFTLVIASFVQQILINAALPLFATFMVLGLVARAFGVTRSFGGAMIAFGLGIGFVYPLMVVITYGFLTFTIQQIGINGYSTFFGNGLHVVGYFFSTGEFIKIPVALLTGGIPAAVPVFLAPFRETILYSGFIALGLTLIPLINLVIADAFIVDFSKAVGEKMDLLSLLTRIL
ncbi:MAG: hypothetical protein KGH72_01800 [Candidatus Micrarchaeota archaeon]|nr:hypothetical protein [Candidatus Micrarchaeota archaeon]